MSLFRRSGRRMLLTEEGHRLLERVRTAITEIAEGVEAIRSGNRDRILTISMVPGFATYWLMPRLAEFIERHPDIEVNIRPTLSLTDFTRDEVDMAVRFGPGAWPGLMAIKLYNEELVPVCSPAFRGRRLARAPGDLLKVPLLHDERQPWSIWFKAVGLDYRDAGQRPRYGDQTLLLAAAIAGLGVALARASLVEADLESGRLVRLFSQSVRTRYSYFIVYPPGSESTAKIQVFQEWLLDQVRSGEHKGAIGTRAGKSVAGRTLRLVRRRGL
ncbi:MAG: LysR family transcriptional regulator, glycine cleavage system transcriptional activator [Betaproteobacteria bacterium]|nr:LysR family transcriptional regulator, glycine cleavage system transcriptional activator [Betaproteobacteria bacterium]